LKVYDYVLSDLKVTRRFNDDRLAVIISLNKVVFHFAAVK